MERQPANREVDVQVHRDGPFEGRSAPRPSAYLDMVRDLAREDLVVGRDEPVVELAAPTSMPVDPRVHVREVVARWEAHGSDGVERVEDDDHRWSVDPRACITYAILLLVSAAAIIPAMRVG